MTKEVRLFRRTVEKRTTLEYLDHSQQLYDWLIRPLESELIRHKIQTLVFVPDGALRTIPFSALHDGKSFLIQQYAVAMTPGLYLTDPRPLNLAENSYARRRAHQLRPGIPVTSLRKRRGRVCNDAFSG